MTSSIAHGACAVLLALATFGVQANPNLRYAVSLQEGNGPAKNYGLEVPAGTAASINADGLTLDVAAPSAEHPGKSLIRLQQTKEGLTKTLHLASISRPADSQVRIAYLLCADGLVFMSPAPAQPPSCK
ncbi:hypothetical protein ACFOLJ_21520 [Rugamonas sp. CCM 8940]|uniref:hypothetical protein n=1 Tax=Rugamonas sp. CCM 8940 TaxID=2765359 RepID=UPI0018F3ED86|nr:hypothetical protein [Rugamonas sp. CCM 8940]MBJ7310728.1 hypothetical protein [Rugamonas sp. CCM 8940]